MEAIKLVALGMALFSGVLLLAGLISPVIVLWWMDYQNRLRVIRIYGTIFLVSALVYFLI